MKKKEYLIYESPEVMVMEAYTDGILCQSMKDNTFEGWGEEDLWS